MSAMNLALIGLGTVGTGVAKILLEHSERLAQRAGRSIEIRRVVVRDLHKSRDVEFSGDVLTDDLRAWRRQ